jgi:hypothetical protein
MIAVCSYKSEQVFRTSSLFRRVVQDATAYFLIIVWAHLTVMIYVSMMGDVSVCDARLRLLLSLIGTFRAGGSHGF